MEEGTKSELWSHQAHAICCANRHTSSPIMKKINHSLLAVILLALVGCGTPNPNPQATEAAYQQVKPGMSRREVYALLGPPKSVEPAGDIAFCRVATWSIPHDSHGWGSWKVTFIGDNVSDVSESHATASGSAFGSH